MRLKTSSTGRDSNDPADGSSVDNAEVVATLRDAVLTINGRTADVSGMSHEQLVGQVARLRSRRGDGVLRPQGASIEANAEMTSDEIGELLDSQLARLNDTS